MRKDLFIIILENPIIVQFICGSIASILGTLILAEVAHRLNWLIGRTATLVPSRQRRAIDFELFRDFALGERCAGLARFNCFNCSVNRVHIGGVATR